MTYEPPPIREPITNQLVGRVWVQWFNRLITRLNGPVELPSYTVATVPAASSYTGYLIYVSDETGGAVPAFSDGTNWLRVTDRNTIS